MRQQNRLQNFAGSAGSCDRITQQDQQQQFVEKILKSWMSNFKPKMMKSESCF